MAVPKDYPMYRTDLNNCEPGYASTSFERPSPFVGHPGTALSMVDENNSVSEDESSGDDFLSTRQRSPSPALPLEDDQPEELPPSPKPAKKAPVKKRTPSKKPPPPADDI